MARIIVTAAMVAAERHADVVPSDAGMPGKGVIAFIRAVAVDAIVCARPELSQKDQDGGAAPAPRPWPSCSAEMRTAPSSTWLNNRPVSA